MNKGILPVLRILAMALLLVFFLSSSVQALSWAYPFVVWEGNTYKVEAETVPADQIGKVIGEVKSKPDGMTGQYKGDASNYYPIGTKYYQIKGISTSVAIAVEEENQWVKAVNVDPDGVHRSEEASYTIYYIVGAVLVVGIIGGMVWRRNKVGSQQ